LGGRREKGRTLFTCLLRGREGEEVKRISHNLSHGGARERASSPLLGKMRPSHGKGGEARLRCDGLTVGEREKKKGGRGGRKRRGGAIVSALKPFTEGKGNVPKEKEPSSDVDEGGGNCGGPGKGGKKKKKGKDQGHIIPLL